MLISVVIPTRNRRALLKSTLDALLSDDYPFKEIIVLDAASTDGTVEMLREYGDKIQWISEKDGGEYFARNKGFERAAGEIIQFCGDDNVLLAGSFLYAAKFLTEHQETDILFGQARRYCEAADGEKILMDNRRSPTGPLNARHFIRGSNPNVMSDTAFFRRRIVERIGVFDTKFLGADYEFWARAAHAGCKLTMTNQLIVEYIISMKSQVILSKSKLALERFTLAKRYGNFWDLVYSALVYIPRQIFVNWLHRVLPWSIERSLRKGLWLLKDSFVSTTPRH